MDTEIPDTVFSVTTLVSHKYGAYASAKCSKPEDAGESAAEVGPGDVGTVVLERDGAVVKGGERGEDKRHAENLQEVEMLADKMEAVARECVCTPSGIETELA